MPQTRTKPFLTVLLIGCVASLAGWYFAPREAQSMQQFLVQPPRPLAEFQIFDADNQPFTRARLQGQWSLLFFGYTQCPDVCPMTLSELAKVYQLLPRGSDAPLPPQVIFISVDPARDHPALLKDFVRYFHPQFLAATGSVEQLSVLTDTLGAQHRRRTEVELPGAEYRVEHSADVWLIDPQANLYAKFPAPHYAEEIARYLSEINHQEKV